MLVDFTRLIQTVLQKNLIAKFPRHFFLRKTTSVRAFIAKSFRVFGIKLMSTELRPSFVSFFVSVYEHASYPKRQIVKSDLQKLSFSENVSMRHASIVGFGIFRDDFLFRYIVCERV